MSTTYPTPTFNWATLGGNATANLQAVPLQQLNAGIGYSLMQAPQPAGGFTSSPFPFGTNNEACALSCNIWPASADGRPIWPGVLGFWHYTDVCNYGSRDMCTFYAGADSIAPTTITPTSATYTATTIIPTPALTSAQVSFIQSAINYNNQRASLIPAGFDNVGMLIDTAPTVTTIVSGTYTSGTGAVTLTTGQPHATRPNNTFVLSNAAGTGSFASLNGTWTATSGTVTGGTTLTFTAPTGLTLTITGGTIQGAKFTGAITGVAADGSSITVAGWYTSPALGTGGTGNGAAGQVPLSGMVDANGNAAYINPCTHMWNMNGVMNLAANTMCQSMTFLEIDSYNYQPAFGSPGGGSTIGISANAHANMNGFAFLALGNWATGFQSQGNANFGFFIQNATTNPGWGYVSAVSSTTPGGHHPFGYYDYATGGGVYRWNVGSNGSTQLGNVGYDNGFTLQVSAPGTAPVITASGPDTNIDVRIVPKGTGMVRTGAPFQSNANTVPIPPPGGYVTSLDVQGADNTFPALAVVSYGQPSGYIGRRADGTGATPTPLVSGDQICRFAATGYDGSVWSSPSANLTFNADGAWSATSHPTAIALSICAPNSINTYEQLRMFSSGRVMLAPGTTAALTDGGNAALTVSGPGTAYGFVSNIASTISGGHHPFVYTDSSISQNRFSVAGNGTVILGSATTDNGLSIATALTGSPVVITAQGPDANINVRFVAKGTGMLQVQSGLQLSTTGPTWTFGAGVPASTQPVGSLYSNTSGAAGARLYVSAGGGTWTAVAGV